MVKLEATRKNGNVVISEESFGHLLNCLANQKFIGEPPPCGDAIALGKKKYDAIQVENQKCIDDFYFQCRDLLSK